MNEKMEQDYSSNRNKDKINTNYAKFDDEMVMEENTDNNFDNTY